MHLNISILEDIHCYCEYNSEIQPTNKIVCETNGNFTSNSFCESYEICLGPSNSSEAVMDQNKKSLCANSKITYG